MKMRPKTVLYLIIIAIILLIGSIKLYPKISESAKK